MGLSFVLGPSGSGKTEWMYRKALQEAKEHPDRMILFIVPEQFSLTTMKDILLRSETKSMSNIEVLSFLRLSYRIFSELSVKTGELLSDTGKSLLLKRVIEKHRKELTVFASNAKKSGFLTELKSIISECYQYGITPNLLQKKAEEEENTLLSAKLRDISVLFQGFQEQLSGKFRPTETVFDLLSAVLKDSEAAKNCICFMDGFTGFTPSQYSLLKALFSCSIETYLSLTGDASVLRPDLPEHELFTFTRKTVTCVEKLAEEAGCKKRVVLLPEENQKTRFSDSPVLKSLEQRIFRYPVRSKSSCKEAVRLVARENRTEEAAFIAADIERKVRTEGIRYGKIAIVTGDALGYGEILCRELAKVHIPVFLDQKRKMVHNPVISMLRAVLANAQNGFRFDSVFRYLKCGFSRLTGEETAKLQNYCIACGIHGESAWKKEWQYRYRGNSEINLTEINELRERVLSELLPITTTLKKEKTAGNRTRALLEFLESFQTEERLTAMAEQFLQEGDIARNGEYRQVYEKVRSLFDHFMELLDEEEMELSDYCALMETGFSELKFAIVPNGSDFVVVGDMTRTRLSDIDILYLAGANEGVTPMNQKSKGLISEAERENLSKRNLRMSPGERENAFTMPFYLYQMLTKPRKQLVISYCLLSEAGEELQPSYFLRRITELFTDLKTENEDKDRFLRILKNDLGRGTFLAMLQKRVGKKEEDDAFLLLLREERKEHEKETEALLTAAFLGRPAEGLAEETARKLYGEILYGSVTRLESYAACAFSHFLKYGLSLQEQAEYKVSAPELGTLYHEALRLFMEQVKKDDSFATLTKEQAEKLCEESVDRAVLTFRNGVFEGNEKNSYLLVRTKKILLRTVQMILNQLKGSLFRPEQCEADYELLDQNFSLNGRIDRFDLCKNEGIDYLRVIDYKSGEKKIDLAETYYGLQVQLLVYLKAARELVQKTNHISPEIAGVLYSMIKDPFLEREKYTQEAEQREYRPNGLFNLTPSALTAMDQTFAAANGGLNPEAKSCLIPVEIDKEGNPKKNACLIPGENFALLTDYVEKKLREEANEILSGEIKPSPSRYKKKTPCEYCAFHSVCGFDGRLPGYRFRDLRELSEDEVFQKMKGGGEHAEVLGKSEKGN